LLILASKQVPGGRVYFAGDGRIVLRRYNTDEGRYNVRGFLLARCARVLWGNSALWFHDLALTLGLVLGAVAGLVGAFWLAVPAKNGGTAMVVELAGPILIAALLGAALFSDTLTRNSPRCAYYREAVDYALGAAEANQQAALWLAAGEELPAALQDKLFCYLIKSRQPFSRAASSLSSKGPYHMLAYPGRAWRLWRGERGAPDVLEMAVAIWEPDSSGVLGEPRAALRAAADIKRTTLYWRAAGFSVQ
jgi:hypothetical protein